MPTYLMPPPSSSHAEYIPEHAYPTFALNVAPSPKVVTTAEPKSSPTFVDNLDNQDSAPIGDEDVHMRKSQDATKLEQSYVDVQAPSAAKDTLFLDTNGLYNFTDARPEHLPLVTSPSEGGTTGADLAIEEVINL